MTAHLESKTIGQVIIECVPKEFQHYFTNAHTNGEASSDWWSWGLDLDDEDSIGTHVWNLLPETCELLSWMPDASDEFIEALWRAVGNQCLTWVHG